jgi:hypothetical protein
VATLALIFAGAWLGPAVARGAGETIFGVPKATAKFEASIVLTEPVTLPAGVTRVEALIRSGSSDTSNVVEILPIPAAGPTTLRYEMKLTPGAMPPNTLVRLWFRVTLADGTAEEGPVASVRYEDTRFHWHVLSGSIVTVHWTDGGAAFGSRALAIGERAVANASKLLGVTETERIDFFIYSYTAPFYDVMGPDTRENVGGIAYTDIRTLLANIAPSAVDAPWVGVVIPHELTHLVFDTATRNPFHEPAHWLNEGLAVYLSKGYTTEDRGEVGRAVKAGSIIPITALVGQFPTAGDRFSLAYAESASAVSFMVRKYGKPALVKLIRSYHDGHTDDEAFQIGLGVDVAGFQAAWAADLGISLPNAFGPQPAPAGPVPPGWEGSGVTPGTIATAPATATPTVSAAATPVGTDNGTSTSSPLATGIATAVVAILGIGLLAVAMRRRRHPPRTIE